MLSLWLSCCVSYKVKMEREREKGRVGKHVDSGYVMGLLITVTFMKSAMTWWDHQMRVYLPSFLLSTLAANFPCLALISRLLLSNFIKDNVLKVLHSTALGLVKARREEGESKVGISLSLPVSKSSAIFLHWIISACSLYAQKYVQKSKIAEISLKVSYNMQWHF